MHTHNRWGRSVQRSRSAWRRTGEETAAQELKKRSSCLGRLRFVDACFIFFFSTKKIRKRVRAAAPLLFDLSALLSFVHIQSFVRSVPQELSRSTIPIGLGRPLCRFPVSRYHVKRAAANTTRQRARVSHAVRRQKQKNHLQFFSPFLLLCAYQKL